MILLRSTRWRLVSTIEGAIAELCVRNTARTQTTIATILGANTAFLMRKLWKLGTDMIIYFRYIGPANLCTLSIAGAICRGRFKEKPERE